ncbi:MAG: hypothetical protein H0T21_02040 [Gemmatimonadaceae bacterium]|nr:hypothetical protein [Gemmatimonadaceae bacterium]
MMRFAAALMALALAGCGRPSGAGGPPAVATSVAVTSGSTLIGAMHDAYEGKWFRTISFLQNNTRYTTTGAEEKSQWYEHLQAPSKLRIAFLPATLKSGIIQVDDRVATFDNARRVDIRRSVNPLLLLTSAVYTQSPAATMRALDSLDVNTGVFRADRWRGQNVYVVGAGQGDTTSSQMWVDRDRLLLVRFIQRERRGSRITVSDIRVEKYQEISGYPIATEFLIVRDGKPFWREAYANVRVNETLSPDLFDQTRWVNAPIAQ